MMFQQEMKTLDLGIAPDLIFAEDDLSSLTSVLEDQIPQIDIALSPMNTNQEEIMESENLALVKNEDNMYELDMKPFMDLDPDNIKAIVTGAPGNIQETQVLIDEMEEFLNQHETSFGSPEANSTISELSEESEDESMPLDAGLDAESADAEKLLDALIKGNISIEDDSHAETATNTIVPEMHPQILTTTDDSGYETAPSANVTETLSNTWSGFSSIQQIITEDGKNVMIIIAPPSPQSSNSVQVSLDQQQMSPSQDGAISVASPIETSSAADNESICSFQVPSLETANASPMSSIASSWSPNPYTYEQDDSSDTDWNPYSPKVSSSSKTKQRTSTNSKKTTKEKKPYGVSASSKPPSKRKTHTITDKKERKKLQNVQAARRYRDKKKAEQSTVEVEEQQLLNKNKELKEQLSDIENEVKTLKKLMTELGLVKLVLKSE